MIINCKFKRLRNPAGHTIATAILARAMLLTTMSPLPLIAQTSEPQSRTRDTRLEEVIVTAQKRAEDVRDVPISIAVMTGDDMREAGIKSFNDMARFMPNISLNDSSSSLYVRGIGSPELNPVGEQAIAFIIDGVYVPRADYLKAGFMDLERIEILKGPQGTLFGRNASGGVINITNGRPTDEWVGSASLTAGNRNIKEGEFMVSGPITDWLSFRAAGKRRTEDGSTYSTTSQATLGDRDVEQNRLMLRYDGGFGFDVTLGVTKFDYHIGSWLGHEFTTYPDDLRPFIESQDPNFETNLDRRTSSPKDHRFDGEGYIVPLEINVEWGEFVLTSVSSWAMLDDTQGGDVDNTAVDLTALPVVMANDQLSQEFRLTSPPGNFEYVAGLYYFTAKQDSLVRLPLYVGVNTFFSAVNNIVPLPLDLLSSSIPTAGQGEVSDELFQDSVIKTKSSAIFGQFKWQMIDTLALTVGGRYSEDKKDGNYTLTSTGPLPIWPQITGADFSVDTSVVDTDFSPKVSLSWEPFEEATFYATYAQGFRAGSYNNGATFEDQVLFDAEKSTTYEVGVKTDLFDSRVRFNLGLFQTDYEDYQITTFIGLGYITSNADEVESKGVEADVTALLLPGLILNATVGYNDAMFVKHPEGGCVTRSISDNPGGLIASGSNENPNCDLSGRDLHRAPKWNGSVRLDYVMDYLDFGLGFDVFVGVDATFKDSELFDSDLDPLDSQDSYWLYNARLGVKAQDDSWRVEVHGKNLSDELVKLWSGDGVLASGSHFASTNDPKYYFATIYYRY